MRDNQESFPCPTEVFTCATNKVLLCLVCLGLLNGEWVRALANDEIVETGDGSSGLIATALTEPTKVVPLRIGLIADRFMKEGSVSQPVPVELFGDEAATDGAALTVFSNNPDLVAAEGAVD